MAKKKTAPKAEAHASKAAHDEAAERKEWKAGGMKGPEPAPVVWRNGVSYRADDAPDHEK